MMTTTAIQLLQVLGLLIVALLTRAALVIGVILVLSVPIVLFAYTVRAIEGFWHRHHGLNHVHHHA